MPTINEFSSLVATLYEAAADSQHWSRFLAQFYTAMNSARGALTAQAEEPGLTKVILEGYTEAETRDYSEYYFQHDRVLTAGLEVIKRSSDWIGPLEEIVPYQELEATEIYNDYYRELDMHYASCVMVGATGPYSALGLAAWRSKKDGPFSLEQLHLVELLTPHLKQAFQLHAKLQALQAEAQAFRAALNGTAVAALALRADGQILAASPPAEALLSRKDVLLRRSGRLHATNAASDSALQLLIGRAGRTSGIDLVGSSDRSIQPGGSMLLPQVGKRLALQVQVLPVRMGATDWGATSPDVLVFISDPGASPPSRSQVLKDLYQLTPLESKLADLFLQGHELKQAAEELKLTYENTRFHLKQIFRKTKTTRQVELLRLLLAIPA